FGGQGLGVDVVDGLTPVARLAGGDAAAVVGAAAAVLGVAPERRPHAGATNARVGDGLRELDVDRVSALRDQRVGLGVLDVLSHEPAKATVGERLDGADLVGVDED